MIDGVKRRHGLGTHANGKEKYVGDWQHDSMHGQGELRINTFSLMFCVYVHHTSAAESSLSIYRFWVMFW